MSWSSDRNEGQRALAPAKEVQQIVQLVFGPWGGARFAAHTGVPVPVFAIGFDAYRFEGFYDNTDIAKQIAKAIRYPGTLPVLKP